MNVVVKPNAGIASFGIDRECPPPIAWHSSTSSSLGELGANVDKDVSHLDQSSHAEGAWSMKGDYTVQHSYNYKIIGKFNIKYEQNLNVIKNIFALY